MGKLPVVSHILAVLRGYRIVQASHHGGRWLTIGIHGGRPGWLLGRIQRLNCGVLFGAGIGRCCRHDLFFVPVITGTYYGIEIALLRQHMLQVRHQHKIVRLLWHRLLVHICVWFDLLLLLIRLLLWLLIFECDCLLPLFRIGSIISHSFLGGFSSIRGVKVLVEVIWRSHAFRLPLLFFRRSGACMVRMVLFIRVYAGLDVGRLLFVGLFLVGAGAAQFGRNLRLLLVSILLLRSRLVNGVTLSPLLVVTRASRRSCTH